MKKNRIVLMMMVTMLSLSACTGTNGQEAAESSSAATALTEEGTQPAGEAQGEAQGEEAAYLGSWYSMMQGVPVCLDLQAQDAYVMSFGDAENTADAGSGTWRYEEGRLLLDGETLFSVREEGLVWENEGLLFTREEPAGYEPGAVIKEALPLDFAGYWMCALIETDGMVIAAHMVDDDTDLYVDAGEDAAAGAGQTDAAGAAQTGASGAQTAVPDTVFVALGGALFGDEIVEFDYADGALSFAEGSGADAVSVKLELQEDGYMRMTLAGGGEDMVLYLLPA